MVIASLQRLISISSLSNPSFTIMPLLTLLFALPLVFQLLRGCMRMLWAPVICVAGIKFQHSLKPILTIYERRITTLPIIVKPITTSLLQTYPMVNCLSIKSGKRLIACSGIKAVTQTAKRVSLFFMSTIYLNLMKAACIESSKNACTALKMSPYRPTTLIL